MGGRRAGSAAAPPSGGGPGAADGRAPADLVAEALRRRTDAGRRYFGAEAERVARLCHRMAERFARGGRLVAIADSPAGRSDARHVAVEFVHPVIVGKRALPALALTPEGGPLALQAGLLVQPEDMVIAFGGPAAADAAAGPREEATVPGGGVARAVGRARDRGCLTIAFDRVGAEWVFPPPSDDPFVRQELAETLYHVLWELVHVFFEHRGLLEGREARGVHDAGASSFLYPFLAERETDAEAVVEDVRASVLAKADEVSRLRRRTLEVGGPALLAAARVLRDALDGGGTLLAFGNGGSATDAMDVVADFREAPGPAPGGGPWPSRAALDLTEDTAILTAIANDVGTDASFARQVIAYGREGDVALAFSTSGSSRNVVRALEESRRRGLRTVALVGYDGGRIGAEGLADQVIVAPSEHVPRIQEAHATAYHVLRALVERVGPAA